MNIDLLSMTWEEFQILALEHVKQSHTVNPLFCLLHDANYIGALEWRVTLLGHPYYTAANKIQVASDALFSKFAEAAYNFFPNAVVFKMIMREPNDPPADSMPADGNSVKRAHPVDANGERRPTIALRTPGAYRFQKYPAVSSSGNQGLSTGLSNTVQAGPDDGVNASPLGGRGHGAVQNNISQSTGSRSVTRAVTKDGPKGMSTPKTHEVGPSPLATNTTAPRVPAGRQPVSTDKIEVICRPLTATARRVVSLPSTRVIQLPQAGPTHQARIPLGPEPPELQSVPFKRFLDVAGIHSKDSGTRHRLSAHGIIHWTFFRSASEQALLDLGFPIGTARLLCEGVALLEQDVYSHR
ncbi:hypothetical protein PtA15_15A37 [Puccinia triticina]|uniref:Uncharacterized protein n=1 Tax=Puccinia triticina TaxID=208348 RepID=A0ABY7D4X7_9BASI|nr:uncharacterized protein PtA15_15A37 [Puccinia triticina]WAQ91648.1 hypothetical protein PtA15_15A37 [Puccinia triticina]